MSNETEWQDSILYTNGSQTFTVTAPLAPLAHPQCPLPYLIKSILQNSGLHIPVRKIIIIIK
jgi:hypothetical protein